MPGKKARAQSRNSRLRRRTLAKFTSAVTQDRHHVYVALLDTAVAKFRKVRALSPNRDAIKPWVYVGLTGLSPNVRFANHKARIKSSSLAGRFGVKLLPELYAVVFEDRRVAPAELRPQTEQRERNHGDGMDALTVSPTFNTR